MGFDVPGELYDRFMGRYSRPLSPQLADFAGVRAGMRVLDVGSGPGVLTEELVARVGSASVAAADPSAPFVDTLRERLPDVRAVRAKAEALPFDDDEFDAALAQLVVHFMTDPVAGLREMARVTRPGGAVAACVWDHAGERSPITLFWRAACALDPDAHDESDLAGAREGHLEELMAAAGLREIESTLLESSFRPASFSDWWDPFSLGIGPVGEYLATLDEDSRGALREACRLLYAELPPSCAWAALGRV